MNLQDIRQRVVDFYGTTVTDDEAFLNRIINDAYLELCGVRSWWWLETSEVLRFEAPVTTGTAQANWGTAAVTVGGAHATAYKYGWLTSGNNTYRVNNITAGSTASGTATMFTIDANLIGSSTAATFTCHFWNDTLTLDSQCDALIAMVPRNLPNHRMLRHVPLEDIEGLGVDFSGHEGEFANRCAILREPAYTSSDTRIRIYPPPDQVAEYLCRYKQAPSDMANDTAESLVPDKHHRALVTFAQLKLAKISREDPDVVNNFEVEYSKALARLLQDQNRQAGVESRVKRRGAGATYELDFKLTNVTPGGV